MEGARNGLLLPRPIARAFDEFRTYFYENPRGRLAVRALNPAMLDGEIGMRRRATKPVIVEGTEVEAASMALQTIRDEGYATWRTIQDQELALPEGKLPYTHILFLHARNSRNPAIDKGWFKEADWKFDAFGPEIWKRGGCA
ncbi:hypothetical protein FRB93_011749 [Tulasnella sp. JGI-2019a]|nr:hypothetical protein FRB93_011749 [Tulasnella sp. JGI-2019a]